MPTRIGFIKFTAFDLPAVQDFEGIKQPKHPLHFGNKVLSLGESHPFQPPVHAYAPQLDEVQRKPMAKVLAELTPLMAAYWEHMEDLSVRREIVRRWYERQRQAEVAADKHWQHVEHLYLWATELLFQRVYERVGRLTSVYRKIAAKRAAVTEDFHEMHKEMRQLEVEKFPRLYRKALENPFIHEIKEPNQFKALDQARAELMAYRDERVSRDEELRATRRIDALENLKQLREKRALDARFLLRKGRFNLRQSRYEIADAFEAAWRHSVDTSGSFSKLIREQVVEQAQVYPELYKAALVDPWETAIRLPNQDNHFQVDQERIDQQRKSVKAVGAHERDLKGLEIEARKDAATQRLLERDERFALADGRRAYAQENAAGEAKAAGRGQVFVAGRSVPLAPFRIGTAPKSTLPLSLGIQGHPNAPEQQAPVPPQLDAYFPATAGVQRFEAPRFEAMPPARQQEEKRQELVEKLQTLQALNGYGAGKKRVSGT